MHFACSAGLVGRVSDTWRVEESYCIHLQGEIESLFGNCLVLCIKATRFFETLETTRPTRQCHFPETGVLNYTSAKTSQLVPVAYLLLFKIVFHLRTSKIIFSKSSSF
jgi:hypothetical protein